MGKQSDFKKTWQNRLCNMGTARTRARVKLRGQKQAGASTQGKAGLMESSQSFERSKAWQLNPKATRHNRKPLGESSGRRRQMRHKTHGRAGQGWRVLLALFLLGLVRREMKTQPVSSITKGL